MTDKLDTDLMELINAICAYFKWDDAEKNILIKEATNEPSEFRNSMLSIHQNILQNILIKNSANEISKVVDEINASDGVETPMPVTEVVTQNGSLEAVEKNLPLNSQDNPKNKDNIDMINNHNFHGVMVDKETYLILDKIVDADKIKYSSGNVLAMDEQSNTVNTSNMSPKKEIDVASHNIVNSEVENPKNDDPQKVEALPISTVNKFSRFAKKNSDSTSVEANTTISVKSDKNDNVLVSSAPINKNHVTESSPSDNININYNEIEEIQNSINNSSNNSKAFRG